MALFRGVIRSDILGMDTSLSVILPYDRPSEDFESPCRVLYLLHGLGENSEAWVRYTGVERYARERGLAVIMPEVQRSFYLDMAYGLPYKTYITEELPELCKQMFRVSRRREDTYIAGLSMGGFGAIYCGLSRPELYAGIASFSGAVDIHYVVASAREDERLRHQLQGAVGMELAIRDDDDPMILAERAAGLPRVEQPALFLTCGTEDYLLESNRKFRDHLEKTGLSFAYREWPGSHEWSFWDQSIRKALDYFLS